MKKILFALLLTGLLYSCEDAINSDENVHVTKQIVEKGFTTSTLESMPGPQRLFFLNENTGWILTAWSVLKTTDGGESWTEYEIERHPLHNPKSIHFIDEFNGFVGLELGRLIKTTDGGKTWNDILPEELEEFNTDDVYFLDHNNGFAAKSHHGEDAFITKTTDGGYTWDKFEINALAPFRQIAFTDIEFLNDNTGFCTAWEYNYDIRRGILLKTTDRGATWNRIDTKDDAEKYDQISFVDEYTGWINTGEYLLNTTDQGKSWFKQYPGQSESIIRFSFSDANHGWLILSLPNGMIGGENYDVMMKTTDGGNTWHNLARDSHINEEGGVLTMKDIFFVNDTTGWALDCPLHGNSRLLKTTNGGEIKTTEQ